MPRGSKDAYTNKQKRKAEHIEEGYEERGLSGDEAERRAWATVNKQDGGGARKKATGARKTTAASTRGKRAAGRKTTGSRASGAASRPGSTTARKSATRRTARSRSK